ncbi:MAG: MmgE/PrpD family protein [Chloroflexota bacterium]
MAPTDAASELAQFLAQLSYDGIPPSTLDLMKKLTLDVLGAMLAGTSAEGCQNVVELVKSWGGTNQSTVAGDGAKVPFPNAVLANVTMARALELDDVHEKALLHPTVAVVPAALAFSEWKGGITGKQFLTACIAAEEVTCRIGLAPEYHVAGEHHRPRGMSFTYQCGTFGAAAVTGRLLSMNEAQLLNSLGNAYSQVAGNQQGIQEAALIVRVQQGLSAKAGTVAALLAEQGITGPKQVLEGVFGYYNVFHRGLYDREMITRGLGDTFEVDNISIKPYPCCKIIHASIAATLETVSGHDIDADKVGEVIVHVNSRESWDECCQPVEKKRAPQNPIEAQFSLPYGVAVAVAKRKVSLASYTPEGIKDPEVLRIAQLVKPVMDPESDISLGKILPMPATVDIHLRDGSSFSRTVRYARGHPRNPMSWPEVVDKFYSCAGWGDRWKKAKLDEIVETVHRLDSVQDVGILARLLAH